MKNHYRKTLAVMLLIAASLCLWTPVWAEDDSDAVDMTEPILTSISIDTDTAIKGQPLKVKLGVKEDGVGIKTVYIKSETHDLQYRKSTGGSRFEYEPGEYLKTGEYTFPVTISASAVEGNSVISQVQLTDAEGNYSSFVIVKGSGGAYWGNSLSWRNDTGIYEVPTVIFNVTADTKAPVLQSLKFDTDETYAKSIGFAMNVKDELPEFRDWSITYTNMDHPDQTYTYSRGTGYNEYTGLVEGRINFPAISPGRYYVSKVGLEDLAGNIASYTARKNEDGVYMLTCDGKDVLEAPVFSYLKDTVKPVLKSASFGSSSLSAGSRCKISLDIVEDGVGISWANVVFANDENPDERKAVYFNASAASQYWFTGVHTLETDLSDNATLGGWHICEVQLYDGEQNQRLYCLRDVNGQEMLKDVYGSDDDETVPVSHINITEYVEPEADVTAPQLTGAGWVNDKVAIGSKLTLKLDITENGSGLDRVILKTSKFSDWGESLRTEIKLTDPEECKGEFTYDFNMKAQQDVYSKWVVHTVELRDYDDNESIYTIVQDEDGNLVLQEKNGKFENRVPAPSYRTVYAFDTEITDENLVEDIENLNEGEIGRVRMDEDTVLTQDALEALKGKDAEILCDAGSYNWTFNGKDMTDADKDLDLTLSVKELAESETVSGDKAVQLDFADNGQLPGKAGVEFATDFLNEYLDDASQLNLYYVDSDDYHLMDSGVTLTESAEGTRCGIEIDHNSTYVISKNSQSLTGAVVKLSKYTYVYSGGKCKPSVTVYKNQKLVPQTAYSVSYDKNTNVGTATANASGKFGGKASRSFKINPKSTYIKSMKAYSKAFKATWAVKKTQTSGYQLQYSIYSSMRSPKTVTISSNGTASRKVTGLKARKKYYARIRTYKTVSGTRYYSSWSGIKSIKTK